MTRLSHPVSDMLTALQEQGGKTPGISMPALHAAYVEAALLAPPGDIDVSDTHLRDGLDAAPLKPGDIYEIADGTRFNNALQDGQYMKGRFKKGDLVLCASVKMSGAAFIPLREIRAGRLQVLRELESRIEGGIIEMRYCCSLRDSAPRQIASL